MKPWTLALALSLFLFSCSRGPESGLVLPQDPPLSGGLGWALVSDSYVRPRAEPRVAAAELGYLRDGQVAELTGRAAGSGLWYRLKAEGLEGWVPAAAITVFSTKAQAERAASARP